MSDRCYKLVRQAEAKVDWCTRLHCIWVSVETFDQIIESRETDRRFDIIRDCNNRCSLVFRCYKWALPIDVDWSMSGENQMKIQYRHRLV